MTPETEDKVIGQLTTLEEALKHLATKEDLAVLKGDTQKAVADLRAEMHKEFRGQTWKLVAAILPIYALLTVLIIALIPHLK